MHRQMNKRRIVLLTPLLLLGASMATAHGPSVFAQFQPPTAADRALLKDAVDIHAHLDPDSFGPHSTQAARSLDVIEMAQRAKKLRMRAFVIKQHYDQTAQIAYLASKAVPGIEVYGQLSLNLTVGGLNPAAVYHFAEIKGGRARIVSMPTWDSENNIRSTKQERPFVRVSQDGELLPEAKAVISAIANAKVRDSNAPLVLATGHISAAEALLVIREGGKQGITRMVATHAIGHPIDMTIAQMKEAVSLGAKIEFVSGFLVGTRGTFTVEQYVAAIRTIGADNIILSSDGGQVGRPKPEEMIALAAGQLLAKGITRAELHKMMVENPAALLSLP